MLNGQKHVATVLSVQAQTQPFIWNAFSGNKIILDQIPIYNVMQAQNHKKTRYIFCCPLGAEVQIKHCSLHPCFTGDPLCEKNFLLQQWWQLLLNYLADPVWAGTWLSSNDKAHLCIKLRHCPLTEMLVQGAWGLQNNSSKRGWWQLEALPSHQRL